MKNKQNGFIGIALIILVALAVVGGGTYFYAHTYEKEAPKELDQVVATSTSSTATSTSSSTTTTVVNTNKPSPTSGLKGSSCGTVLDTHIFAESDKRTSAEIKALTCISNAAISCTPAYLDVTGKDSGSYQVLSRSGENCSIATTFGGYKKCEVPVKVIADLKEYAITEKEPIEGLIVVINLLMAFEGGKDVKTGEEIKISCQK